MQNKPSLKHYKIINTHYEVLIPLKNRFKARKLNPYTKEGQLLAILGIKTYLIYILIRKAILKLLFIRILKGVPNFNLNTGFNSQNTAL